MPMYDLKCPKCGLEAIDVLEPVNSPVHPCPRCDGELKRVWITRAPCVIPDSIPGGIDIRHGVCHEDGTPQRFYSKSDIAREAKRRGVQPRVEHIGDVANGSDKAPRVDGKIPTTRWF